MKYATLFLYLLSLVSCVLPNETIKSRTENCQKNSTKVSFQLEYGTEGFSHNVDMSCIIGSYLPDIQFKDLDGKMIKTEDFKGEISILHFWFIKCKPCIEEIPDWNILQKQYSQKGIKFIAFSRDSNDELKEFLISKPFDFTHIPGSESIIKSQFAILWGYPMTIVTDKKNKVIQAFGKLSEINIHEIADVLSSNDRFK